MADLYNLHDFTKWLIYAAENEAYYKPHENGYMLKQDMGAALLLYIKEGETRSSVSEFMERLRSMPLYSTAPRLFRTFIYVLDLTPDEEASFEAFLQEEQRKNINAKLLTEFVIYNFGTGSYRRAGGGKVQDKDLRRLLESSRAEAGMTVEQRHYNAEKKQNRFNEASARMLFRQSRPDIAPMIALIIINVTVFLLDILLEQRTGYKPLEYFGIQDNALVFEGEWWRLFTSMFLHMDVSHLLGNMLMLIYLSLVLLKYYSGFEYLSIYMLSGIVGNVFSLVFMGADTRSLGASGAIMGLGGVLVYRMFFGKSAGAFRHAGSYFILAFMVIYNLARGLFIEGIDNYAHFCGFAAGILIAIIISKIRRKKNIE